MKKWYVTKELTELRKSKRLSVSEFCLKAGIDESTYYQLQQGKQLRTDTIKLIARRLQLQYGMDEGGYYLHENEAAGPAEPAEEMQISSDEQELIKLYRRLNWEDRSLITQFLRRLGR
jgi:transcriptional regulator with XRE-family HTH domain